MKKRMFPLLIIFLRYSSLANSQQIECENLQTRKEDDELVTVCRIDQLTSINSFNVTFSSELNENIEEIYAKNNDRIRYLPKNIYEKFPNLKTLNFEECSLKAVTNENLQKLISVTNIDLSYNEIRTINVGTFDDLINLQHLILSHNKISRMNGDVFRPLVKLRLLNFDENFCISENFSGDDLDIVEIAESISQKCLIYENYLICQVKLKVSEQIKETCECSAVETSTPKDAGGQTQGNTNGCDEIRDLYDDSGNYLRTVCAIPLERTHDAANKYCVSNGMSLFMLEPPETKKALLDFANSKFNEGEFLHVHGKTSAGCSVLYNGEGLFDVYSDYCNSRYYFFCQFTRVPKTVEPSPLNTSICAYKDDLFDTNNNYHQSACLVAKNLTYNQAEKYCQANGMDLFDISSEKLRNELVDYAVEIFGEYTGDFYSIIKSSTVLSVKGRNAGECQFIVNGYNPFETNYQSCYNEFYFFCGFQNPNPDGPYILANGEVNTTNCDEVKDLFDDSSSYIKTVCLVPLSKTYDGADAKCQSYGMSLYNIDTPETKKALLDFSNSLFGPSIGKKLFVEGKTSEGCSVVANVEGFYEVSSIGCTETYYFYCQFVRTPITNELGPLNTNVCQTKLDLFDTNKNYLQSACFVSKKLRHSRAEAYCQANGMDLFNISSEESKTALIEYAAELFGESDEAMLQVKGREGGECQYITNVYGLFVAHYIYYCYDEFTSFCGYQNSNPTVGSEISSNFEVNTTNCDEVKDLYDDSGNYIRTACLAAIEATYNDAEEKCLSYGMILYKFDSSDAKKALLDFINSYFKKSTPRPLYIHGKTSEGCSTLSNGEGFFDVLIDECWRTFYFHCQYTRVPTSVEPGPLNTNICDKKKDLFDTNKNYLQSACLVVEKLTYSRSEVYCQANGMDLFDISSEEPKAAVLEYATDLYEEGSVAVLHVKGREGAECQFITNEYSPFRVRYGSCYDKFYSFCGFNNEVISTSTASN